MEGSDSMNHDEIVKLLAESFEAQLNAAKPIAPVDFEACFPGAQVHDFKITDKKNRVAEVTLSFPVKGVQVQIEISDE